MATLQIADAIDLRDILPVLGPGSRRANWKVRPVATAGDAMFEATGHGGETLETLSQRLAIVSGPDLLEFAKDTRQVIWGEFVGVLPASGGEAWVTIRAIDSSFFEVATLDETVLRNIRSSFKRVKEAKPSG
jgi:hypothetical protein